ncbi:MAG: hypothetical protein WD688_03975 [Candidatus Binatia bacterium]
MAVSLSVIRRPHKNRDHAIRAAYETGAYSYQQVAKEFGVHFTTVGRIVRKAMKSEAAADTMSYQLAHLCFDNRPDPDDAR